MEHTWIKFEDQLPTNKEGEQIKILFGHLKWATYMLGMYYHCQDLPLRDRISEYRQDIDSCCEWNGMLPTHWMKLPENPRN